MTENQRLKELIDLLNFKTQKDFAAHLNIQPGSLSDVLRGKGGMGVSTSIKDKLVLLFGVNLEWLEKGTGQPLLKKTPVVAEALEGVPYFDIPLSNIERSLVEEDVEYFVNYKPFNDCTAYLPVYGDSMYPRFAAGEIIAVKEVENFDVLQWGEAYVVITDKKSNNLRSVKLLFEHPDQQKIILRSSNPNFKGDITIDKQNLVALYIIKGKITRTLI